MDLLNLFQLYFKDNPNSGNILSLYALISQGASLEEIIAQFPDFGQWLTDNGYYEGDSQSPSDSSYSSLLDNGSNFNGSFESFLNSLGLRDFTSLSDTQKQDFNKQLLDALIQQKQVEDTRQFNEQLRDEQRIYDNPINQLGRLTGAGISRDAAIALLGAGSTGSTVAPYQTPVTVPSGIAPSQSTLNDIQGKTAIAGAVFGGLSAVHGLMGLGFSASQAVQQVRLMQYQKYMNQQDLDAFNGVNKLTSAVGNAVANGLLDSKIVQSWQNADDVQQYLLANKDGLFAPLFTDGTFNSVFGSTKGRALFNQDMSNRRDSRSQGDIFNEFIRQQRLQNELSQINISKVGSELTLLGTQNAQGEAQIAKIWSDIDEGRARVQVLNKNGKWIDVKTVREEQGVKIDKGNYLIEVEKLGLEMDKTQAQVNLMNAQTAQLNQQNYLNSAGLSQIRQMRLEKIEDQMNAWNTPYDVYGNTPRKDAIRKWVQDGQNAADAARLLTIQQYAVGDFQDKYPDLYNFAAGVAHSGIGDFLRVASSTAADVAGVVL